MKPYQNWMILLALISSAYTLAMTTEITCTYFRHGPVNMLNVITDEHDKGSNWRVGELLSDNKTMICPKSTHFCYALWLEEPENKSQTIMLIQGCWESSGKDCGQHECIANRKPPKASNNTKFCCCAKPLCNNNVTDGYVPTSDEPETVQPAYPYVEQGDNKNKPVIITIATACVLVIILFAAFFVYRFWSGLRKPSPDSLHLMETPLPPPSTPIYDLSNLKFQEIIGKGRYGLVWRASLNDKDVAVKIFQIQHKQYYLNEKDIYTLPHFEHSSLLKYLGSDERVTGEGRTEYLIVLSYAPLGCLQDYLRAHVIDWPTLCKTSQSIAKGLAHLHIDIRKGDKLKPCISHRDMNSRNVLVKSDLSCCICDMGFAMKISGSKYYSQNGEQNAETTSLSDVGTLRYMAPEVLEGAVNLRDCESSLKQIDVYALGLILWEIMTRCEDLYQGVEVPPYRMPFEAEIGLHATFEHMQVLISRNKARPLFSEVWKDSNQAVRLLKETIEDCWDQDAEARLTSLCVEERLQELPVLWERHKASIAVTGISPTVNPASSQLPLMRNSQHTTVSNTVNSTNLVIAPVNGLPLVNDTTISMPDNDTNGLNSFQLRNSYHQNRESSTSEATVETTVTMSPSEPTNPLPIESAAANKNANAQQVARLASVPLQPYQGRNPCIERNMIMEPLEEISVSGNTLLEKGIKFKNSTTSPNNQDLDVDNIFDVLQLTDNVESNALVSNDVLNHSTRSCNPIPYVQNAVHGSLPTRPKQPNVPGNGQYYDKKAKKGAFGNRFEKKKGNSNEQGSKKSKDWGFRSLLEWKKSSKNNSCNEPTLPRVSKKTDAPINYNPAHSEIKSNLILKQENSDKPIPVEACLQRNVNNTQVTTRPMNGPYKSIENGYIANGNCQTAEVGVAHLSPTKLQNGQAPVIKCRSSNLPCINQVNGLSNCLSESDLLTPKSDVKLKRPTTLPLKSQSFKNSSKNSEVNNFQARHCRTSKEGDNFEKMALLKNSTSDETNLEDKKLKIVKRVKTPFRMKAGRFSLYDDRMMSQSAQNCLKISSNSSLQHARECVSMPIDIDTAIAFKNGTDTSQKYTDKDVVPPITYPNKNVGIKATMNGIGLLNGTLPNHWMTSNGPSRNADSGSSESTRKISCL